MAAATHTPGPWLVSETFAIGPAGEVVACTPNNHPRREANARLIAAAPELLEALEGLLKDYIQVFSDHPAIEPDWNPEDSALVKRARAAIAKAKGDS